MAIYKVQDLINAFSEVYIDGLPYVDITELPPDEEDDAPASISISALVDEDSTIEYDSVDALSDDELVEQVRPTSDDFAPFLTYGDLRVILSSIDKCLAFSKSQLNSSNITRDEKDSIKSASIELRNMQARLRKVIK